MAINPAKNGSELNDPTKRANELNDPQFSNQQGYFPYDLTHAEYLSTRFGEVNPSMHIHTVPADRIVMHDNTKTIHTQIDGNFMSTINQYVDSFYVPMRAVFPNNYEKLIPNPTKGKDLPNMALPQFPFNYFIHEYLLSTSEFTVYGADASIDEIVFRDVITAPQTTFSEGVTSAILSRLTLLATVISRGQLLDYLGVAFDDQYVDIRSELQNTIDQYFDAVYALTFNKRIYMVDADLRQNIVDYTGVSRIRDYFSITNVQIFRDALATSFEKGKMMYFYDVSFTDQFLPFLSRLVVALLKVFGGLAASAPDDFSNVINTSSNPFDSGFINLQKILSYQLCIAQYYTNDSVDNIFNSDLYMQLLRATMFPSDDDGISSEPTFLYNGVPTEYDYISCGALYHSLIKQTAGHLNRQYVWMTLLLLMRRSLRYGDYFSTARPNMLAVGQLQINVTEGSVSPIDVTKNLLMQRYLNAVNYIGSGFLQYFASIYGVTPSDTGTYPRFIAHRKIPLASDITVNTSNNQGAQTTNLVGYSDDNAFDVFIDDHGVLLNFVSYDVLPVYTSGIENTYHLADRFDYYNPMLQGIGDQPIRVSEIIGDFALRYQVFGYTMRNAEYKYKLSKAHGAFINGLPGFLLKYPLRNYMDEDRRINIDPDFIRDKPIYMDSVVTSMTGTSPANYYHFIVACVNQVQCARKIQATPPVLF